MPNNEFTTWLHTYMEEQHLTQESIAAKLGVRHPTVGDWLRGKHPPNPKSLRKLAEMSGEDPIALFVMVGYLPESSPKDGKFRPAIERIARRLDPVDDLMLELVDKQLSEVLIPYFEKVIERERGKHGPQRIPQRQDNEHQTETESGKK